MRATRRARLLIELTEIPYKLSRPFAAPPGIPAARAQALQRAFAATHRDPQYLADAAKQRVDVSPVTAEEVLAGAQAHRKRATSSSSITSAGCSPNRRADKSHRQPHGIFGLPAA